MAEAQEQEPSIEEILESIRQIISDDEKEDEGDAPEVDLTPEEEPVDDGGADLTPEEDDDDAGDVDLSVKEEEETDDVLELTDIVEGDDNGDGPDLSQQAEEDDASDLDLSVGEEEELDVDAVLDSLEEEKGESPDIQMFDKDEDAIISDEAAADATGSMAKLASNVFVENDAPDRVITPGRVTLEDITRDLMRPMLREWLDENLPPLVERLVERELQKIAKRAEKE